MLKRIGLMGAGLTALLAAPAWAHDGAEEYGHHMDGVYGWGMAHGPVMMIGIIAIVVVVAILILRRDNGPNGPKDAKLE
ncbi:MAG: hypothetical protein HOM25_08265 [Rhodospirillaceae bacterium]|jgi:uncharacterized membrane protein|nr:hypothetical protein [Rhodospirillaceae bacterium]MBT5667050.1 hypothetical protein [Rhodospirillaceae bacterium]MBT5809313.1 hypothetical protein [Rhodospirillaceae bacterium]